jgi:catechol 2,3-dioxygenase-like lactoylglutathione lyase family enzyme
MYDIAKTHEFYIDWLGFSVDWEHRFEPDLPLYMQVSRSGCLLHLSQHHGDGSPNARVRIDTVNIQALHEELAEKKYGFGRPGLVKQFGGTTLTVIDPVGNQIEFFERDAGMTTS